MIRHALAIAALIVLTTWLFISNEYMTYRQVRVEVEDKMLLQNSKGRERPVVVYKRADGVQFDREVSVGTWMASLPGQSKTLNIREFDMRQSTWENVRYFFLPVITLSITGTYLLMFLGGWALFPKRKETNVQEPS